ncbi:MAG: AMP-binding protein [Actinobacteria bacterium]|nr:AMP-binding protein [Actinomycetota bacterium]
MSTPEHNLARLHEAVAAAVPDRACVIWRDRRLSWAEVTDRTRRLAAVLAAAGLGRTGARERGRPWTSPHDHVALYLLNGNEYLEGMLGAAKARAAAFNVNHRYVASELERLLTDARARAVIYAGRFSTTLADALDRLPEPPALLLRVDDGSADALLPGALDYETALREADPAAAPTDWSPDDLYVLYTGGTTGTPKGVLWRQADFLRTCLGVTGTTDAIVAAARSRAGLRALPAPPFMHGAASWNAMSAWIAGGTVVVQDAVDRFDPADVLDTCERHEVSSLLIVGDAFARPLVDELAARPRDLRALRTVMTGGAILSARVKEDLLALLPGARVVDILGSSETGRHGTHTSDAGSAASGTFDPSATTVVLSPDRSRVLPPGDPRIGWLAQRGAVPLAYLGDAEATAATFPVIAGERYAVGGDRARLLDDGRIELHGRDSVTINTGGEKVFAEEVEQVLKAHPAVYDALVVGQPSERFGQEVAAVVRLRAGSSASPDDLRAHCGEHLARYKLPRTIVFRNHIARSPSGKPDYAWARAELDQAD